MLNALIEISNTLSVPIQGLDIDKVGDDDTRSFLNANVSIITLHSHHQETWKILLSTKDDLPAIDDENHYLAFRLIAFYLKHLDYKLLSLP